MGVAGKPLALHLETVCCNLVGRRKKNGGKAEPDKRTHLQSRAEQRKAVSAWLKWKEAWARWRPRLRQGLIREYREMGSFLQDFKALYQEFEHDSYI